MAVYTSLSFDQVGLWLNRYTVGKVIKLVPIAEGIENSNYFLTTNLGAYVLTLYERLAPAELKFYLDLMAHLRKQGIVCPQPIADRSGAYYSVLKGKPASLVTRLKGRSIMQPNASQCAAAGRALAHLHAAGASFKSRLTNRRGLSWWQRTARAVKPFLNTQQKRLLSDELLHQEVLSRVRLPKGAIHGDLFRDNALFYRRQLSGIIDFGFAATDSWAYDLAITVNDWCSKIDGTLHSARVRALLKAYQMIRPLTEQEQIAWPSLLRAAALRFWLSRLYDYYQPRAGELTYRKDPMHYERILRARVT